MLDSTSVNMTCEFCAKDRLTDDASDEDDEGGKSNARIDDGSSLAELAEFSKDEVLRFFGERKVSGEGGLLSCGVGGRFEEGGGMREGGTVLRREIDCCL